MNPLSLNRKLSRLRLRHPVRREDLSAYLDDRLIASERARVEEHVDACGRCRQELEELRAVVRALRGLSYVPVRRSFRLSPAQVQAARAPARPTWAYAYGPLGATAAAAAILFAVLLGGDLLTLGGGEEAITSGGGPQGYLLGPEVEEAIETPEGLSAEEDRAGEEAPKAEPTIEGTPLAMPAPAGEAPAEAFAPATPTQPPEAERAERPAVVEEEGGGTGRIALRIGEAAAGGVALGAVGGLLIMWRRRART